MPLASTDAKAALKLCAQAGPTLASSSTELFQASMRMAISPDQAVKSEFNAQAGLTLANCRTELFQVLVQMALGFHSGSPVCLEGSRATRNLTHRLCSSVAPTASLSKYTHSVLLLSYTPSRSSLPSTFTYLHSQTHGKEQVGHL